MSFEIGIPTLNRADLLVPTLLYYKLKVFTNTKIHVIDNGDQDFSMLSHLDINIVKEKENIGVGKSWNKLCKIIFENNNNALILNDDICVDYGKDKVDELIKKYNGFMKATPDWCAFILPKNVFEYVGEFDECFYPAYYEDKSYEYRMKLKGVKITKTPLLNPFVYQSSKTLEKMPQIIEFSKQNKKKYIEMWGGEPTKEKFKTPYNK